jgi:hypothetical protein
MQKGSLLSPQEKVELPRELANANPAARYEAWQRMRQAMQEQIRTLDNQREDLAEARQEAKNHGLTDPAVDARIAGVDARLTALHSQLALVDQELVRAAALAPARSQQTTAETRVQQVPPRAADFPEELIAVPVLFILCVGLPLAIAYSRRIWRRTGEAAGALPKEIMDRLQRMDQNIDTIALEVERIGENQRYLTKQTEKDRADLKA